MWPLKRPREPAVLSRAHMRDWHPGGPSTLERGLDSYARSDTVPSDAESEP